MQNNVQTVTNDLAKAMKASVPDVLNVYNQAMQATMVDPRFTEAFKAGGKVSPDAQKRLNRLVEAMAMQTAQTMQNFSNTTAISESYRKHVDRAVTAASTGLSSYSAVMRQALREIGSNGLQVVYESGYHRRLDTALRQNIIDGINQISQRGAEIVGEELGYDAVEITAHLHSAPDHEPVQGRVFLNAEYEKMQTDQPFTDVNGKAYAAFRRPIQEWNCKHFALPFSTKYSKPRYTEKQLQEWAAANKKGCIINGKHLTNYEATQVMRKLELEQRKQKDIANAARVAGDDVLRRQCQQRINELAAQYQAVSDACGVRAQWERTSVEGFKAVKALNEIDDKMAKPNSLSDEWKDAQPSNITKETLEELRAYAKNKKVKINNISYFDGNVDIFKSVIDRMAELSKKYIGITKKPLVLSLMYMQAGDYGNHPRNSTTIEIAVESLRDLKVTERVLQEGSYLAAKTPLDIIEHEWTHVIMHFVGNKGLTHAEQAYYNVYGKSADKRELREEIITKISELAARNNAAEKETMITGKPSNYGELLPELSVRSKNSNDKFVLEMYRLFMEDIKNAQM